MAINKYSEFYTKETSINENKEKKGEIILFISVIAIFVLFFLGLWFLLKINRIQALNNSQNLSNIIQVNANTKNMQLDNNSTDAQKPLADSPLSGRQVYYAGLEDCSITKDTAICLENLKKNDDIFMAYKIYDSEYNLIYETGLIPSGEYVKWFPSEYFEAGTHEILIQHIPYYDINGTGEYIELAYQPVNILNVTLSD